MSLSWLSTRFRFILAQVVYFVNELEYHNGELLGWLNNARAYCRFINARSLETDNFPMIYTVEQNAIPDLIRELHQTLTAKDSLYAKTPAKLLYIYAHHRSSRVDSAPTLFAIQLDSRFARQNQPACRTSRFLPRFSFFIRKISRVRGAISKKGK